MTRHSLGGRKGEEPAGLFMLHKRNVNIVKIRRKKPLISFIDFYGQPLYNGMTM